jgi:hypothetical protein
MSERFRCSVCHQLPALNKPQAGRSWQCPACNGELINVRRGGRTCRLVAAPTFNEGVRRSAGVVVGLGAAVLLLAGGMLTAASMFHPDRASKVHEAIGIQPDACESSAAELPLGVAANTGVWSKPQAIVALSEEELPLRTLAVSEIKRRPLPDDVVAAVKSSPQAEAYGRIVDIAAAKPAPKLPALPPWATKSRSAEMLRKQLFDNVKEVALDENSALFAEDATQARPRIEALIETIDSATVFDLDGFVRKLQKTRPDLAGLPWLMGSDRVLKCDAVETQEQLLAEIRKALAGDPDATTKIVRNAVFDVSQASRDKAIKTLRHRARGEVAAALLEFVRHPWPAAAQNAVEALTALNLTETVPLLTKLLQEPDPGTPFYQTLGGKETFAVRELVRVNHERNCLLCHAPATRNQGIFLAPIPIPGEPSLAPSEGGYGGSALHGPRNKTGKPRVVTPNLPRINVRVEMTYLREDFSVFQPLAKQGKGTELQRFDYLVRVRPITPAERTAYYVQQSAGVEGSLSEHKEAILYALRVLTGEEIGIDAHARRELVAEMADPKG